MESYELLKLLESINDLKKVIIAQKQSTKAKNRSDDIGLLMEALAKAQGEMDAANKDSVNPHFRYKYADLNSIIEASRPALTKNGLAVCQQVLLDDDDKSILVTTLGHTSGQYISSCVSIKPPKEDVQSLGSYITYLRRYTYAPLIGVSTDDDDGEAATRATHTYTRQAPQPSKVSEDQAEEIEYKLVGLPDLKISVLKHYGIEHIKDLPKDHYRKIIEKIEKIKDNKPS